MGVMAWCIACSTVVWAYDHEQPFDLRGWLNMAKIPCPRCDEDRGNFDGWASAKVDRSFCKKMGEPGDMWGMLRAIAKYNGVKWQPSLDNTWFWRPDEDDES